VQPPPYSQPPYPPPTPPARRGNRGLVIGLGAGALLLFLLLAAVVVVLATSKGSSSRAVRGSLQFRKVLAVTNAACPAGQSGRFTSVRGDACYQLGDGMTISKVNGIELRPPGAGGPGYSIEIRLLPADSGRLGSLTGEVAREQEPRNQLAVVIDGKVASSPQVVERITGGTVVLSGNYTRPEAQRYVDLVKG
jgi:hypothetical protein